MQLPDEPLQVHSQMSPEDTVRCQQAIALANTGQKHQAYQIFYNLYDDNPEDTTLLTWLAYTTPDIKEAQHVIGILAQIDPNHPNLPMLRNRLGKMRPPVQPRPQVQYSKHIVMECPYCGYVGPDRVKSRVSTGGWVTFVMLLILFFPLCWIGLLIRRSYSVCGRCGIELGEISY